MVNELQTSVPPVVGDRKGLAPSPSRFQACSFHLYNIQRARAMKLTASLALIAQEIR
jgi:hypothetical protein